MIGDRQLARLVKRFTDAPSSPYVPEDIAITFGEARIKYQPAPTDFDGSGAVDRAVYFKLMLDAATLAASSLTDRYPVVSESFNVYAMKAAHAGELVAAARLIHAERNTFTVEVRLIDDQGRALASGHGSFSLDLTPRSAPVPADESDTPAVRPAGVAYGALWRTPYGFVHLN